MPLVWGAGIETKWGSSASWGACDAPRVGARIETILIPCGITPAQDAPRVEARFETMWI